MEAAEDFLKKIEASKLVTQEEQEQIRKDLVADLKAEAKKTVNSMATTKFGGTQVLVSNADNKRKVKLSTERMRKRLSSFRLSYLSPEQVNTLKADGTLTDDPKKFIRASRRQARHAREFLKQIGELEPSLQEEIEATLDQINDNDMDLLKLEVKSMTRLTETMNRAILGRKERGEVLKEFDDWDINRQLWNLSLLEHPDAVVRQLFANASERMASATTTDVTEIPKVAHLFVGLTPQAESKLTPDSRTASFAFRLFNQEKLTEKYNALPPKQASPSTWRGLGLGFNTREWYIPVPPAIAPNVAPLAVARRARAMAAAELARSEQLAAKSVAQRQAAEEAERLAVEAAEAAERRIETERQALERFDRQSEITQTP